MDSPICHDIMNEVFVTECGHSFCYVCISQHIELHADCPLCRTAIKKHNIHPNFQLNTIARYRSQHKNLPPLQTLTESKKTNLSVAKILAQSLSYSDLASVYTLAMQEKKKEEGAEEKERAVLLNQFLVTFKKSNEEAIHALTEQNKQLEIDIDRITESGTKRPYSDSIEGESIKRLKSRFNLLKHNYESVCVNETINSRMNQLKQFSHTLYDLTRYEGFSVVDTLYYNDTIVSSIEFDRDEEFFGAGGVGKDIKIYDYGLMMSSEDVIHCPVRRIQCGRKISCLSWNPYLKSQMASSDYDGLVTLWDVTRGSSVQVFNEHKKRAWSVDISRKNPNIMVSGSDDTTVKVWALNTSTSTHTLQVKHNVCCAKFALHNSHHIAVGSADHHINVYDLRNPSSPLKVYVDHKKAVSYVKWLENGDILSASTDSTLKLWDRNSTKCKKTFSGHTNEKNFVGFSVDDDWITCGSETNTLFAYHISCSKPIAQYQFPSGVDALTGEEVKEDTQSFVSSVCWKSHSKTVLAANSKGIIKVLQLK